MALIVRTARSAFHRKASEITLKITADARNDYQAERLKEQADRGNAWNSAVPFTETMG
jgi:hypothetical protein